jgi:hypothetical protein
VWSILHFVCVPLGKNADNSDSGCTYPRAYIPQFLNSDLFPCRTKSLIETISFGAV